MDFGEAVETRGSGVRIVKVQAHFFGDGIILYHFFNNFTYFLVVGGSEVPSFKSVMVVVG